MKLEHESSPAVQRGRSAVIPEKTTILHDPQWARAPMVQALVQHLPAGAPRYVARAPLSLDVMGALGDYVGGLVVRRTLAEAIHVAVQPRTDGKLSVRRHAIEQQDGHAPAEIPSALLIEGAASEAPAEALGERLRGAGSDVARCVFGTLTEMHRAGAHMPREGLSVVVQSNPLSGGGLASTAAAVCFAVATALELTIDPAKAATWCRSVENGWLSTPAGPSEALGSIQVEADSVQAIHCDPGSLGAAVRLPEAYALLGIDCGTCRADAAEKFAQVRTATFMGCYLIDRIIQHDATDNPPWNGYLGRISITDYVERFRDRIPTRLKGKEFLDHFGECGDPLTSIDPAQIYKVRSRTEHHIYEHARCRQFMECLSRGLRSPDSKPFADAGELMYASHWSYGQRCGLGSIETDLLVNLIRRYGAAKDVLGARVSGRGCGGVVAVLTRATDDAFAALETAMHAYADRSGHTPRLLRGSIPGVAHNGVCKL